MTQETQNNEYCKYADVTIEWKNTNEQEYVKVAIVPQEELQDVDDNDIFFYFNSKEDFIANRLGNDGEDFEIIKVHNLY